jgi:hypothetical protein
MQNLACRTETSLRLLIWMPRLFCKIRQGHMMYLVGSDGEGSGALYVQKGLDNCTWTKVFRVAQTGNEGA